MGEESCDVHSEERKDSSEKNKKRKVKTPAQVMALEKFYIEHKYPTEEMKLELAEQIGLTEKQVSGWFCHRRLKDKRLREEAFANNVRQDHSSGVIQDRGSGLGQDSCGSTKHGDYYIDPREVESRKPYGRDFAPADLTYENRSRFTQNVSGMDNNTSSESSSSLEDRLLSQNQHPNDIETSRCLTRDVVIPPSIPKVSNVRGYKPSGYLKVKGEMENAAITAVKRQLGVQYREDGPPLGVDFQPLPPGAFESSVNHDTLAEPYYVADPVVPHSPEISAMKKQCNLDSRYEMHATKLGSPDSYLHEAIPTKTICAHESEEKKSYHKFKRKMSPFNHINPFPGQISSLDVHEDPSAEALPYTKRSQITSSNYPAETIKSDSVLNNHGQYGAKVDIEHRERWVHNYDNVRSKNVNRSEYSKPRQTKLILDHCESLGTKEKLNGEKRAVNDFRDPVRVKMHPGSELTVAKRVLADFPQRDYLTKVPISEIPERINHVRRSAAEMRSGLSEDETAETSSSLD